MIAKAAPHQLIPRAGLTELVTEVMAKREYLARLECPLSLDNFLAAITALPDPCPDRQAADAIVRVLRDHGYAGLLLPELEAGWELRWPGPEQDAPVAGQDDGEWMPACQWCGEPCNSREARYCKPSHRNAAWKRRQREQRQREQQRDG